MSHLKSFSTIHQSVLVKNSLFTKFIKLKDTIKKKEAHDKYKYYRSLI